jgi:hypothetical protein
MPPAGPKDAASGGGKDELGTLRGPTGSEGLGCPAGQSL